MKMFLYTYMYNDCGNEQIFNLFSLFNDNPMIVNSI